MIRATFVCVACVCVACLAGCAAVPSDAPAAPEDPHLWLEEVTGQRALAWVADRNRETANTLAGGAAFKRRRDQLRAVFDATDRIPYVTKLGPHYYNFWRDPAHPRGLWRRTTLAEYRRAEPAWSPVLDLDALARAEGENWVHKGFDCLGPDYRRCLVWLSQGGGDAVATREFDLVDKAFVAPDEGGFALPVAKSRVAWAGSDALFVATDFGPGSLTESGYPRIVKLLRRGQPLEDAQVVFEGQATDVSVAGYADLTPGFELQLVLRAMDFHHSELFVRRPETGELVAVEKQSDATVGAHRGRFFFHLRSDWQVGGRLFRAGSLLVANAADYLNEPTDEAALAVLFEPTPGVFLTSYDATLDHVLLNVLDNVRSRVYAVTPTPGEGTGWQRRPLPTGGAGLATVTADAVASNEDNRYFLHVDAHLTPPTLALGDVAQPDAAPEVLKRAPAHFNAEGLVATQHWAQSADGTAVPYFQVGPEAASGDAVDAPRATMMYGYGGYEISMLPHYSAGIGLGWLKPGGVYVVANIRGGGEFGPAWHQAALRENRARAYEDFIAIAEDLVRRGVTEPRRLGVVGGSNGGLLTGNMLTRRPDLFGAVVAMVPLMDMRRYHLMLAGASWMAELGNPDDPEDWRFLRAISPYHNIRPEADYPPVLLTTSTRDDRVHPGHARKMAAKLRALGHDVTFYENTEGGHGGAANNAQSAHVWALVYEFLRRELMR